MTIKDVCIDSPGAMTNENRLLAEKVMGWRLAQPYWLGRLDPIHVDDWHPRRSVAQAMMLLGKFKWWMLNYEDQCHECGVRDDKALTHFSDRQSTPEAAIVEAVLRAIEEEP